MALNPMSIAGLLHKWLNHRQIALDLSTISNNVEIIASEFNFVSASSPVLIQR